MWVRNVNQTVVNICMKPDHLRGLNLGEAAKSSDPEVRDQVKACIVRRQVSTTSREGAAQNNPVLDQMLGIAERFGRYVSDARKAVAPILICGGIMALIVGFIWLLIVQTCAWFIVWTTVWSCLLFLIGCTLYAWFKAGSLDAVVAAGQDAFNSATDSNLQVERPASLATAEEDTRTRWKYLAWFMTGTNITQHGCMRLHVFIAPQQRRNLTPQPCAPTPHSCSIHVYHLCASHVLPLQDQHCHWHHQGSGSCHQVHANFDDLPGKP